jgi:hypothetical protein
MPKLPAAWAETETLEGLDLVNKAELLDTPFRISAIWFQTNEAGVHYVYVEAEKTNGEEITFNDSSSGVRAQIISFLSAKGQDAAVDTATADEPYALELVVPRGLRVSEFMARDERGREKPAKTYYLTTSGRRRKAATSTTAKKAAPRKAPAASASPSNG